MRKERIAFYALSMLLALPGTITFYAWNGNYWATGAFFFVLGELCTIAMLLIEIREQLQHPLYNIISRPLEDK